MAWSDCLSSGAGKISSLSMFVSFGATVRVGRPRLSSKGSPTQGDELRKPTRAPGRAARRLRLHRPVGRDQAIIGYLHVRRTVRNA